MSKLTNLLNPRNPLSYVTAVATAMIVSAGIQVYDILTTPITTPSQVEKAQIPNPDDNIIDIGECVNTTLNIGNYQGGDFEEKPTYFLALENTDRSGLRQVELRDGAYHIGTGVQYAEPIDSMPTQAVFCLEKGKNFYFEPLPFEPPSP
ncbi:hypothetical protein BVX95_02385 [archaeon D22]|nr:hypothetical protein BVX95_02385 [archaeon D22]